MKYNKDKKAYSVLLALLMTSFIIIIVSGIFKLILQNMYDTRGMQDYLKAYQASEGAMELALKKVKDNSFGYEEHIFPGVGANKINQVLRGDKGASIGYDINSSSSDLSDISLDTNKYIIYPLFYSKADKTRLGVKKLNFTIKSGDPSRLVWNIIGDKGGISSTGSFTYSDDKLIKNIDENKNFSFSNLKIGDFLENSTNNYLILYNSSSSPIRYDLKTLDSTEKFSLNNISIISVGKVGDYKQNLKVDINIADNLNLLKYSILSPQN